LLAIPWPLAPGGKDLVEGDEPYERDLGQRPAELALGHAELPGELAVVGRAPQLVLELRVPLDGSGFGAHRSRHPVNGPELVDDGAPDARDRVGLELEPTRQVELLQGVDEAEDPVAHEVGLVDGRRQSRRHPAGHELDQRRVVQDEPLARVGRVVLLVVAPQLGDRGRARCRQARGCVAS
jgi:hypothetical protein